MRQYVLVSYDVSDPKRLRRTYRLMRGYGEHIQLSVFLCQLSDRDLVVLREKLSDIIHHGEDQVIMVRLGRVDAARPVGTPQNWQVLGKKLQIRDAKVMIF